MTGLPSLLIVLILSVVIYGPMGGSGYMWACGRVHTHVCSLVCICVVSGTFNCFFFPYPVKKRGRVLIKIQVMSQRPLWMCVSARIYRTAVVMCSSTRVSEVLTQIHTVRRGWSRSHWHIYVQFFIMDVRSLQESFQYHLSCLLFSRAATNDYFDDDHINNN